MEWKLRIEDISLQRLDWASLEKLIEDECDKLEGDIKRAVKAGRKAQGLDNGEK